ncbi:MAG: hypothetical protein C0407_11695 [Desulfobacca sp.]|nr:hypothetical protein [Desulfobacca sp.]
MRCPECGTISFDHLDRCSKCQTDLTSERLRLNLLGIRPNPISLKEILDQEAQISRRKSRQEKKEAPIKAQTSVQPEGPGLTLGEGFSLSSDDSISLDPDRTFQESRKPPQKEEGEIELSLEGLELTLAPKKDL